jgi:hypothetical protein
LPQGASRVKATIIIAVAVGVACGALLAIARVRGGWFA